MTVTVEDGEVTRQQEDHDIAYATKQCGKCDYQYDADNCPRCNEEPAQNMRNTMAVEDVRVSVCCSLPESEDRQGFCSGCGEGTSFELVEQDVEISQRQAIDSFERYVKAHEAETDAKATKALESPLIKGWLKDNGPLYDGESGLEARLTPHSAPRWLSEKITDELLRWAFEQDVVKFSATKLDELAKKFPEGEAIKALQALVNPGGTGEPRLSVTRREGSER